MSPTGSVSLVSLCLNLLMSQFPVCKIETPVVFTSQGWLEENTSKAEHSTGHIARSQQVGNTVVCIIVAIVVN